jgi:hypothetical protein
MLIVSALAVLALWALIAITLIGIGSALLPRLHTNYSLGDAFWMGLALSVAFLEIWGLVAPVASSAAMLLFAIVLLGLLFNRSAIRPWVQNQWQANRRLILPCVVIAAFLALRACIPCDYYDTGLYGAPAVRWIMTYPAVPGLANLHGRLGFNSSAFLCVAVLNSGVWKDLGTHLFPGFVMAAMFIALLPSWVGLITRSPLTSASWFRAILTIPVVFWAMRSKIVGTLTDEPATIACLVGASTLFDVLCSEGGHGQLPDSRSHYPRLIVAMTLFAVGVAFKISTIVFAFLGWCLAFRWLWRSEPAQKQRRPLLTCALVLSALILLPWCVRGIILTGYPVFPAAALGVPADWRVPAPAAKAYADGVRSWGRNPDAASLTETRGTGWVQGWIRHAIRDRVSLQVPLAISLASLGIGLVVRLRGRRFPQTAPPNATVPIQPSLESKDPGERLATYRWLWLLLPSVGGVVFWFWASPDPRFGQFSIWTMAGTLGTWGIMSFIGRQQSAGLRVTQAAPLQEQPGRPPLSVAQVVPLQEPQAGQPEASQGAPLVMQAGVVGAAHGERAGLALWTQRFRAGLAAGAILALAVWCFSGYGWREPYRRLLAEGGLTPLPQANVKLRKTLSGLTVYVPAEGNQCWDAPLPCTPYFDRTLRLRDGKSLRCGFASEGKPEF